MSRTNKWIATLAAGGTAVGAAVALGNAPAAKSAPKAGAVNTTLASLNRNPETAELSAAVAQANHLQTMINDLRKQLVADEQTTVAAGGTKVVVERVGGQPVYVNPSGSPSSAATAAIAVEQARINSEEAALSAERNTLAADAAQLRSEQAQLQKEQETLASQTTATTAPSGSSGESNPGGDS